MFKKEIFLLIFLKIFLNKTLLEDRNIRRIPQRRIGVSENYYLKSIMPTSGVWGLWEGWLIPIWNELLFWRKIDLIPLYCIFKGNSQVFKITSRLDDGKWVINLLDCTFRTISRYKSKKSNQSFQTLFLYHRLLVELIYINLISVGLPYKLNIALIRVKQSIIIYPEYMCRDNHTNARCSIRTLI